MRKLVLIPLLCLSLFAGGCTAQQMQNAANTASKVIAGILSVAQAEEASLPAADAAAITPWVSLGQSLESQLNSCIEQATAAGSKAAAFGDCFTTFAAGLLSPTELNQLRLTSPATQAKVQLWVTVAVVGVNGALAAFNIATIQAPAISQTAPTAAEIRVLADQISDGNPMIDRYCQKFACEPVYATAPGAGL